jgi:hypothetical protein
MRRVPSSHPNSTIHREQDRAAFGRLLLVLFISLVCTGGFVMAARQHVSAVRLGYQTEELRHEQEKLKADQAQLKMAREQALTPSRLIAEANKLGLQSATVKQFDARDAGPEQAAAKTPAVPKKSAPKKPDPAKR